MTIDEAPGLQVLQTINAVVFALSALAWIAAAREIPRFRGYAVAPIFYSLATIAYYALDYFFNPQTVENTSLFTVFSAWLRLVGGILLLGVAIITVIENRKTHDKL